MLSMLKWQKYTQTSLTLRPQDAGQNKALSERKTERQNDSAALPWMSKRYVSSGCAKHSYLILPERKRGSLLAHQNLHKARIISDWILTITNYNSLTGRQHRTTCLGHTVHKRANVCDTDTNVHIDPKTVPPPPPKPQNTSPCFTNLSHH